MDNLFDRPGGGENAILVQLDLPQRDNDALFNEFQQLALSADVTIVASIHGARQSPEAKYFIGSGKVKEIHDAVIAAKANIVLLNHTLTPSQERNLEKAVECRVLDRTGLILDIFAQRARSYEGKLQVELAQLKHLTTRLVRGWSHLERQKGGIGLRGPGETQLEVDRRLIRGRIKNIEKRLSKVRSQREQGRRARQRVPVPTVSLVGYTNAGKSTLFRSVTAEEVYVADQLFATLDPTLRRIDLPEVGGVILADTVGFVRDLPHDLVAAFKATLEETQSANLLLHVVDASDVERNQFIESVDEVLTEIHAEHVPQLLVFNKIDRIDGQAPQLERNLDGKPCRVWLSAQTGAGLDLLQQALQELLGHDAVHCCLQLLPSEAKLRAQLYELSVVIDEEELAEGGWRLTLRLPERQLRFLGADPKGV